MTEIMNSQQAFSYRVVWEVNVRGEVRENLGSKYLGVRE